MTIRNVIKPIFVGFAGITIFVLFSGIVFYLTPNKGWAYFVCGITGSFGMGYFLYKFASPISPAIALIIVPFMFSGAHLSDYVRLKREPVMTGARVGDIARYQDKNVFGLIDVQVLHADATSYSYSYYSKEGSSSKKVFIPVFVIPLVDTSREKGASVEVYAACSGKSCNTRIRSDGKFAVRLDKNNTRPEIYDAFGKAAQKASGDSALMRGKSPVFVELIHNLHTAQAQSLRNGILVYLGLLALWFAVSIWSIRADAKS